jgi:hypothetical protein
MRGSGLGGLTDMSNAGVGDDPAGIEDDPHAGTTSDRRMTRIAEACGATPGVEGGVIRTGPVRWG